MAQKNSRARKSRLHDEKGNRVSGLQLYELPLAGALKASQMVMDRPYLPWFPFAVIRKLNRILDKKRSRVLEYGSGRSTIWFARHSYSVISIESHLAWHHKVSKLLKKLNIKNVEYQFLTEERYSSASDFADESFDLVIIDGNYRSKCLENACRKLKPGGYLYLDNSDTDMTITDGDMRLAEAKMRLLAEKWSSRLEFYTGFSPGNLHPHQGALLRR